MGMGYFFSIWKMDYFSLNIPFDFCQKLSKRGKGGQLHTRKKSEEGQKDVVTTVINSNVIHSLKCATWFEKAKGQKWQFIASCTTIRFSSKKKIVCKSKPINMRSGHLFGNITK